MIMETSSSMTCIPFCANIQSQRTIGKVNSQYQFWNKKNQFKYLKGFCLKSYNIKNEAERFYMF